MIRKTAINQIIFPILVMISMAIIYFYSRKFLFSLIVSMVIVVLLVHINIIIEKNKILNGNYGEIIYRDLKKKTINDKLLIVVYIVLIVLVIVMGILECLGKIEETYYMYTPFLISLNKNFIFTNEILILGEKIVEVNQIEQVEKIGYTTYLIKNKNRIKIRVEFGKNKEAEECFKSIVNFD